MTHPPLMRGVFNLRVSIAQHLEAVVPDLIDVARTQWPLMDEFTLPYPDKYDWYDMDSVNKYPAIGMVAGSDSNHGQRVDITDAGAKVIHARYNMRIFIIAASPKDTNGQFIYPPKEGALMVRDDLTAIVQAALLETPAVGRDDVRMVEESLETTYLEALQISSQNKRCAAASIISADFNVNQATAGRMYGVADNVNVHPAMM